MAYLYILSIFADDKNAIEPERVTEMLKDAEHLGADTAPLELIDPAESANGRWGLRIRITDADE